VIPASRQRNYLQSALYVVIAGLVATVLLERLLTYAEAAEKASVEATVSRLNSAMYARLALLVLRGEQQVVGALDAESPFRIAHAESPAYLGEFDGPPPGADGGKWYFDRSRRELVYLPNLKRYLHADDDAGIAPESISFRTEVHKSATGAYSGVVLVPARPWRWDPRP
jgi:hypothetical protein